MWESVNNKFWLYIDSNVSKRVPSSLIVEGFVLVLGVHVTSEDALTECLATLDACHNHPKAFTIAAGGLYCNKADLTASIAAEAPSPYVKVDCSLPHGLHTQWHAPLHGRAMLQQEARITEKLATLMTGQPIGRLQTPDVDPNTHETQVEEEHLPVGILPDPVEPIPIPKPISKQARLKGEK